MRRASLTPMSSIGQEPLIVVEESGCQEEDEPRSDTSSPRRSLDIDSPQNPYLLSPWRDPRETRKHSLPTPACTSGITASQVRRLSERGGEGSGPSPREAAFLATLSTAPAPQPGGRRHSVVTISRVPPALFGRGRRESVAAVPCRGGRAGPPATDRRGSSHNLALDIMDDIVTARKVRMKLWNTSDERVCEVQPLDETDLRAPQRYTHGRRYSDFVGCVPPILPTIPSRRRASEQPPGPPPIPPRAHELVGGIVCSNTDLLSILTSLTSSATEINRCDDKGVAPIKIEISKRATPLESRRSKLINSRSNSFDASVLDGVNRYAKGGAVSPSSWFVKRHQTLANKKNDMNQAQIIKPIITFSRDGAPRAKSLRKAEKVSPGIPKVVWDKPSGSVVDAQVLGSAIEVFLRQSGGPEAPPTTVQPPAPTPSPSQGAIPKVKIDPRPTQSNWYSGKSEEEDSTDACDTSLCSTLKDLFVK